MDFDFYRKRGKRSSIALRLRFTKDLLHEAWKIQLHPINLLILLCSLEYIVLYIKTLRKNKF